MNARRFAAVAFLVFTFMFCEAREMLSQEAKTAYPHMAADLPRSAVMLNPQFRGVQPIYVFVVPVGRWSDGTPAPIM